MDQIGFATVKTPVPGVVLCLSETEESGKDGGIREVPSVVRILGFYDPDGNHHQFWAEPNE